MRFSFFVLLQEAGLLRKEGSLVLVSLCCYRIYCRKQTKKIMFQFLCVVTSPNSVKPHVMQFVLVSLCCYNIKQVLSDVRRTFQFLCVVTWKQFLMEVGARDVLVSLCCYIVNCMQNLNSIQVLVSLCCYFSLFLFQERRLKFQFLCVVTSTLKHPGNPRTLGFSFFVLLLLYFQFYHLPPNVLVSLCCYIQKS